MNDTSVKTARLLSAPVIVAALGYFVDIYDLVLFSIVRVASLKNLGFEGDLLLDHGVMLINMQMTGMLVGGIVWGILGDKRGRLSVLFGSIFLYSIANIANGFVDSIGLYAALRFIAGVGLAGELGAGITLVSEVMSKENRGMGTTVVAGVGVSGAILAGLVGETFDWRTAYFIGGGLGLALLILRIGVYESGMFSKVKHQSVRRGDFFSLFTSTTKLWRYLKCILIGVPLWFVVGILVTFSPEFGKVFGITEDVSAGRAIMFCYLGLTLGDLGSGFLSQVLKSRRKVVILFLILMSTGVLYYLYAGISSVAHLYAVCLYLGIAAGYWAVFVTIAAEQFGTNLRATVATTVPNIVRGSVVVLTLSFKALHPSLGFVTAATLVGVVSFVLAFVSAFGLQETFGKDLDYLETN